jgi:hypothetical protein
MVAGLAVSLALAGSARAQEATFSDVPDTWRFEVGGFYIGAASNFTFNSPGVTPEGISFEQLGVPTDQTQLYVEGFFRPWRRHQFSLSWYGNSRDGSPQSLKREINWGGYTFATGATVTAHTSTDFFSGAYRFAAYKTDDNRFEIGPALGFGYLHITAAIQGEVGARLGGVQVSAPVDISKTLGSPTGDAGAYLYWWPLQRMQVRADFRYILVEPGNTKADITDGRGGLIYHPWKNFGLGVEYTYTRFVYNRTVLSTDLGGSLRYSGVQALITSAF